MAIAKYVDIKTGETLFKVRVRRYSTEQPGVQIDRRLMGIKTLVEAEKSEKKLLLHAERELITAESKSSLWGELVDEWEVSARKGNIFIRQLSPKTIDDYVSIIRDHAKDWMTMHVLEIDKAHAWVMLDRVEREISISRRKRLRTAVDAVFNWGKPWAVVV